MLAGTGIVRGDADVVVDFAWAPVDQAAERLFRQTDTEKSGFLSVSQFKAIEPQLNGTLVQIVRRGALRGVSPDALNAKSSGVMLPGSEQISRPEFVLEARWRATRLLRMAGPGPSLGPGSGPGPGMPMVAGVKFGRPPRHHGAPRPARPTPPPPPLFVPDTSDTAARPGPRPGALWQ